MSLKPFDKEGSYTVRITHFKVKPTPKEGDERAFCILLYGETEDGYGAVADMNWLQTIIGQGRNQGITVAESTRKTLAEIGVVDGSPCNLQHAIDAGLKCQFAMRFDEYKGERRLRVKFVNPASELIDGEAVDWSQFGLAPKAGRPAAAAKEPQVAKTAVSVATEPEAEDNVPF